MSRKPKGEVLYVRVSKQNKAWLEKKAKAIGLSMSDFVNMFLNDLRTDKQVEDTHHENSHRASFL